MINGTRRSLPFFAIALLTLAGCDIWHAHSQCEKPEKTVAQCEQELDARPVACAGVLQSISYGLDQRSVALRTILRFRDGSVCLTDRTFEPTSVNGVPPGTRVSVVWARVPVASMICPDGEFHKYRCDYVQALKIIGSDPGH